MSWKKVVKMDLGHRVLPVLINPIEQETSESEDRVDLQGRTSPCSVRARSRRFRFNSERFEFGQSDQAVAKIPKRSLHLDSRGAGGGGSRGPSRQNHHSG
jgi:hypothetical protein